MEKNIKNNSKKEPVAGVQPKAAPLSNKSLESLSRQELVDMAKDLQVKNYSRLSKAELVKAISGLKGKPVKGDGQPVKENKSPAPVNNINIEALSRQELVDMAKDLKVKNYSRLSKSELLKAINKLSGAGKKNKGKAALPVEDLSEAEKFEAPVSEDVQMVLDTDRGPEDFEALSRQELVDIAKDLKIKNYSRLSKTRLLKLISDARTSTAPKAVKVVAAATAEPVAEEQDSAGLIERIAQHLKSPYVDEREAKSLLDEHNARILLSPSKYTFGNINKEFLLEGEENIELPDLYEENKLVLLPIDPFRVFTYWNLNRETLSLIERLNLQQLVLKINDVTNIIYNGSNANHYWFESCLPLAKNWYIYLLDGNKNLKVEMGYVLNGEFKIIASSNTIFVPRRQPSSFVADKFVIVRYPEPEPRRERAAFRPPSGKVNPYYGFDDDSIAQSYYTRRLSSKMPVFALNDGLPDHFIKEYEVTGPAQANVHSEKLTPPAKLPGSPPESIVEPSAQPVTEKTGPAPAAVAPQTENITVARITTERIPESIKEQFEYFTHVDNAKIIVDSYYYEIPGQDQKLIKVYYQWYEEGVPYRKEFFWTAETPQIHDKIYKISWGPTWVKEFIGGSERIRFIGASERFLGGSERFMGGSEMFLGASGRFMGASEIFQGGSERFMGASEIYLGASDRFAGGSERHIGGSEQFIGASEQFLGASNLLQRVI
jgi:hypothetical protein